MNLIILVGLIKLLLVTEKPFLCSGIYATLIFILGTLSGNGFLPSLLGSLIALAFFSLYFWLLDRSEGGAWWSVCIGGIIAWIALPIILN